MWNKRNRDHAVCFFILLTVFFVGGCAGEKKSVDPYRDSSDTRSVARARPVKPLPPSAPETPLQKKSTAGFDKRQNAQLRTGLTPDAMLPLLTLVDDRIVAYEGKIEQWEKFIAETSAIDLDEQRRDKIAVCQGKLLRILTGYNELHQQLISRSNGHGGKTSVMDEFLAADRLDIDFLESDCQQIIADEQHAGGWIAGTREILLKDREEELEESMAAGEYLKVIELYAALPLENDQEASYAATYNYGQALLRSGREYDAAKVFQKLLVSLQEQNQVEQEFKLMQLIADIQFGMEEYNTAFERYIDIINRYAGLGENVEWARKQQTMISMRNARGIEVRTFAGLLRGYLSYNPDRDAFRVFLQAQRFVDDFPESSMIPTVNHILFESGDRAESWFARLKQRIQVLRDEKQYEEALRIIERLPMHEMPTEKQDVLNLLTDDLIAASLQEEESRRVAEEEALQDIWSRGQGHMSAKEYDQAIEVFGALKETTYSEGAGLKIVEASQLAARQDRKKAAEIFVRASKLNDRDKKVAMLFQSRKLLRGIIEKYPQSGLVEKVEKNLERIEEEIDHIDPSLLIEQEVMNDEYENSGQPVETTVNGIPIGDWEEQVYEDFPRE